MTSTIAQAMSEYLKNVALARSANTVRSYHNALSLFTNVLDDKGFPTEKTLVERLAEEAIAWFITELNVLAPTTERMYLTAVVGFYQYLLAESLASPNLYRIRMLIRQRARRHGQRLPQFPREQIEKVLDYAIKIANKPTESKTEHLRNLRDRAFLITLADTGLRVHEACGLRRGDIDWNERRAVIVGKGNKQAVVRFSTRSITALKDYLIARSELDGASGRPLTSLPIFARHDRGAGRKVKRITTATGRDIVEQRVGEAIGPDAVGTITPHSFRHYFVTMILRGSGGNIKLAQELARHSNISTTQLYAHLADDELDRGYHDIFEG
jgi:integrase/recombinase XerC